MVKVRWMVALALAVAFAAGGCGKPLPEGFTLAGRWQSAEVEGLGLNFDPQGAAGTVEVTLNKGGSISLAAFRYSTSGSRSPFTLTLRREGAEPRTLGDISVTCVDLKHIRLSHTINVMDAALVEREVAMERP